MASGIPKRAVNVKNKESRKRSWERGQVKKQARKDEQAKREAANRELGSTGKERANLARKAAKRSVPLEQEDLLEQ